VRSLDPSPAWQKACDEAESDAGAIQPYIIAFLFNDLHERYPDIDKFGFDLGLLVQPKEGNERLLEGGTLRYGIFPCKSMFERIEHSWPLMWAPCSITLPVSDSQNP